MDIVAMIVCSNDSCSSSVIREWGLDTAFCTWFSTRSALLRVTMAESRASVSSAMSIGSPFRWLTFPIHGGMISEAWSGCQGPEGRNPKKSLARKGCQNEEASFHNDRRDA